jgi:hypothetical protein
MAMGQIHQLILTHGIEEARARAKGSDKLHRQCLDAAFAVMSDEEHRVGLTHAGFAMTALPHKAVQDRVWIRHGGGVKLRVESGLDVDDQPVGLPYGSIARLILLYLQTEAVNTRSMEVELGRSMNNWLSKMDIDDGGKNFRIVREQSRRLSLCRLTFFSAAENATFVMNGSFVRSAILPDRNNPQLSLWQEAVKLDEGFYRSLLEHPLPVREAAIREISRRSMAIDVYVWLAYRLHVLRKATPITWVALYDQFGAGFQRLRAFRDTFRQNLAVALAAYPEAHVDISDAGLLLHPSEPPIPERRTGGATRVRSLA